MLDPTDTAKLGTLLAGAHAVLTLLSPSRMMEVYGNPSGGPVLEMLSGYLGAIILGFVLQAYYRFVRDEEIKTAVGISTIPYIAYATKVIWNQDHKAIASPAAGHWFYIVMGTVVAHACFTDASYVHTAIKLHAIWCVAEGIVTALLLRLLVQIWKLEANEVHDLYMRMLGVVILGLGVYQASLAWDVDPMKAFGYGWIPQLFSSSARASLPTNMASTMFPRVQLFFGR